MDRFEVRKNDAPEETGSSNKSSSSMWWRKAEVNDLYWRPEHATRLYQQTDTDNTQQAALHHCLAECAAKHTTEEQTDCLLRVNKQNLCNVGL